MLRPKTSCFGGGGDAFRVDIKRFEGHFPFLSDVMRHHEVLQDDGSELPRGMTDLCLDSVVPVFIASRQRRHKCE
ncbi:hypothetical protein JCM18909A_04340 [Cutibacterium acnes subsp. elongatum]